MSLLSGDLVGTNLGTIAPAQWTVVHAPTSATQAIATKGSGAAGVKHVCTGVVATIACGATAQTPIAVQLLDGAAVLLQAELSAPVNGSASVSLTGLCLVGTAATAMTVQFAAAGVAASVQTANLIGFDAT